MEWCADLSRWRPTDGTDTTWDARDYTSACPRNTCAHPSVSALLFTYTMERTRVAESYADTVTVTVTAEFVAHLLQQARWQIPQSARTRECIPWPVFSFPGIGNLQTSFPGFPGAREWRNVLRQRHWLWQFSQLAVPTDLRAGANVLLNRCSASKTNNMNTLIV